MANFPDIKEVNRDFREIDKIFLANRFFFKQIILQFRPKIAGKHYDVYEAYYRSLDPKDTNAIQAMDAARFLKKSGLSDVILSRVSKLFLSFMGRCLWCSPYLYALKTAAQ